MMNCFHIENSCAQHSTYHVYKCSQSGNLHPRHYCHSYLRAIGSCRWGKDHTQECEGSAWVGVTPIRLDIVNRYPT